MKTRYVNMVVGVTGLGLVTSDRLCTLWKAARCDLPKREGHEHTIPRESEVKAIVDSMGSENGTFDVLSGSPGVGKTTAVLAAARQRGSGVHYIDGALVPGGVMQEIGRAYRTPILTLWEKVWRTEQPVWKTVTRAADWYSWWFGQRLVLIIDHVDKVPDADAKHLLNLAEEGADFGKLLILFVTSERIPKLRGSTSFLKASEKHLGPVSVQSAKDLLAMTKTPERHWGEVIYLSGCNLGDIWYYIYGLRQGSSISKLKDAKMQAVQDARICTGFSQDEANFWKRMLEAGPSGLTVPPPLYYGLASNYCARMTSGRVYFQNGVCVDDYACMLNVKVLERVWERFQGNDDARQRQLDQ